MLIEFEGVEGKLLPYEFSSRLVLKSCVFFLFLITLEPEIERYTSL